MKGLIIKLTGGLYTVLANDIKYDCKARGNFRHRNLKPVVGDYVEFSETENYILEIMERKNQLIRPSISNVDQAILTFSAKEPDFNYNLLDRLLSLIELANITPIIIVTKIDLLSEEEYRGLKEILSYYQKYYDLYYISSKEQIGIDELRHLFEDKVTVLSGQSGVGKSSFINALDSNFSLETNQISKALGRGKHTTRHTELHEVFGGLLADTPGFSSLEYSDVSEIELANSFVDYQEMGKDCRYSTCIHINEPKCKVKENLALGKTLESRYLNYKFFQNEVKTNKKY